MNRAINAGETPLYLTCLGLSWHTAVYINVLRRERRHTARGECLREAVSNMLSIYHASVNIRCSARVAQEIDPCLKSSPAR